MIVSIHSIIHPHFPRPIAAYGALDLPTYYIDLTPFVPVLVDGKPHTISLDVVSAEADHAVLQNWYLTANLQITLDESQKPTTGHMTYNVSPFALTSTTGSVSANGDLQTTVQATRNIQIESVIRTGSGKDISVVWKQDLSYINKQSYRENGTIQVGTRSLNIVHQRLAHEIFRLCISFRQVLCSQLITVSQHLLIPIPSR